LDRRNFNVTKYVWASEKVFGRFAGIELVKGALFHAGMKVLQNAFEKPTTSSGSSSANTQAANIVLTINMAAKIVQDAQNAWIKWQAAHYDDRASYGSISVMGFDLQLFQVLQTAYQHSVTSVINSLPSLKRRSKRRHWTMSRRS
jgi:hypothetical protein